jgi:hypothetical protein
MRFYWNKCGNSQYTKTSQDRGSLSLRASILNKLEFLCVSLICFLIDLLSKNLIVILNHCIAMWNSNSRQTFPDKIENGPHRYWKGNRRTRVEPIRKALAKPVISKAKYWQLLFYGGRVQTMSVYGDLVKTESSYGGRVQCRHLWGAFSVPVGTELIPDRPFHWCGILYRPFVPNQGTLSTADVWRCVALRSFAVLLYRCIFDRMKARTCPMALGHPHFPVRQGFHLNIFINYKYRYANEKYKFLFELLPVKCKPIKCKNYYQWCQVLKRWTENNASDTNLHNTRWQLVNVKI